MCSLVATRLHNKQMIKYMVRASCVLLFVSLLVVGCTENVRTRAFGGKMTINLPAGQKLVNATFKESDLWYLTRPMRIDESPEVYTFSEDSTYGVLEGQVKFVETK